MRGNFNIIERRELTYMPRLMATKSIIAYVVALLAVSVVFYEYAMPIWLWVVGVVSILLFFSGSQYLTKIWHNISTKSFAQKLLLGAFGIRLLYVIFIYFFNLNHYGTYYESNAGDITWYVPSGLEMAEQLAEGSWGEVARMWMSWDIAISDLGYVIYLAVLYLITGSISEVVLPLILKAFYGAITCVLMYRVAQRHFSEHVARMTAIFCMLQANMIWWCGSMMKETEMILLFILYLNELDKVLSRGSFKFQQLLIAIGLGLLLFTFRAALGIVAFLAMFVSIVLIDGKLVKLWMKIAMGLIVVVVLGLTYGESLMEITEETASMAQGDYQQTNMEWRTRRDGGNSFAKYASAVVFAPLIFTIPFPNMVYTFQSQEMQMMVSGGNFVKNVLSFFVIIVLIELLLSGSWKKHILPVALLCGYLVALVFSVFAQSGRFHMPVIPLEMMFAAYGVSLMHKVPAYKRWYNYVLAIEVVVCIAWGWFKLAGRGWI